MTKDVISYCGAVARFVKEICCCSEAGGWSPMTEEQIRIELQREKERKMLLRRETARAIKKRIFGSKKKKKDEVLEQQKNHQEESREIVTEQQLRQHSRLSYYSTCDGNWSLSRNWKNGMQHDEEDTFDTTESMYADAKRFRKIGCVERLKRLRRKLKSANRIKSDSKILKEQLRYDKNIKRHIKIRFMLSLRLRKYIKKKTLGLPSSSTVQHALPVPVRTFPKIDQGIRKSPQMYNLDSVMLMKKNDATVAYCANLSDRVLFDVNEAVNDMITRCHGDLRLLDKSATRMYTGNMRYF